MHCTIYIYIFIYLYLLLNTTASQTNTVYRIIPRHTWSSCLVINVRSICPDILRQNNHCSHFAFSFASNCSPTIASHPSIFTILHQREHSSCNPVLLLLCVSVSVSKNDVDDDGQNIKHTDMRAVCVSMLRVFFHCLLLTLQIYPPLNSSFHCHPFFAFV